MRYRKHIRTFAILLSATFLFCNLLFTRNSTVYADGFNPGIEAFVTSLYSDCLGRTPDPTGLNDWCTKLSNGTVTGKQCAYGFFFSPEFQTKANQWSDDALIDAYYKVFLNRSADPSGKAYWASQIANSTNDISILFTGFADSNEFSSKCASYGIVVGDHINVPDTVRTMSTASAAAPAAATTSTSSSSGSGRAPNGWFNPPAGNEVWLTEAGSRYHSRPGCSGMIDPSHTTLAWAQANGYTACARCH
ncbi:MAG: DUF4214 domain-containing protein [Clostridiales bacterium]|nr:DUF4214 domain-containing protein [Clostridiales bacterium]